jgi:pSer/pThr/pTyr-binding forkhead associated (FHA) protein
MSSTNGTYLDGRRVSEVLVGAAAELSLGGYRVKLRPG